MKKRLWAIVCFTVIMTGSTLVQGEKHEQLKYILSESSRTIRMPQQLTREILNLKMRLSECNTPFVSTSYRLHRSIMKTVDTDRFAVTMQTWSGGTWTNTGKVTLNLGLDFEDFLAFVEGISNMAEVPQMLAFEILEMEFTSDFYMLTQEYANGEWVNIMQIVSETDPNDDLSQLTFQIWQNSQWVNYLLFQFIYDGNHRLTELIVKADIEETGTPVNALKMELTYTNGFVTLSELYVWLSSTWQQVLQITYTNDANGNPLTELTQIDVGAPLLVDLAKYTNTYVNNLLNSRIFQSASIGGFPPQTTWVNQTKDMYNYTGNNLTEHLGQIWQSAWVDSLKETYQYVSDKMTHWLKELYINNAWVNSEQSEITYDGDNPIQEIVQDWNGTSWVNSEKMETAYTGNLPDETTIQIWAGAWVNSEKYLYDYNPDSGVYDDPLTGNLMPKNYLLENHPNPFNPTTTILFSLPVDAEVNLKIYDLTGKVIKTLIDNRHYTIGTHRIDWNGRDNKNASVASGVYFYQLTTKAHRETHSCLLIK